MVGYAQGGLFSRSHLDLRLKLLYLRERHVV
jgi:hypothetical protein